MPVMICVGFGMFSEMISARNAFYLWELIALWIAEYRLEMRGEISQQNLWRNAVLIYFVLCVVTQLIDGANLSLSSSLINQGLIFLWYHYGRLRFLAMCLAMIDRFNRSISTRSGNEASSNASMSSVVWAALVLGPSIEHLARLHH